MWPDYVKQAIKKMGGMVESVYSINEVLLFNLEERIKLWDDNSTIGDVLLKLTPFLKVYITYIAEFDGVSQMLNKCEKIVTFNEKLHELYQNYQDIRSYLITPVQVNNYICFIIIIFIFIFIFFFHYFFFFSLFIIFFTIFYFQIKM